MPYLFLAMSANNVAVKCLRMHDKLKAVIVLNFAFASATTTTNYIQGTEYWFDLYTALAKSVEKITER